MENNFNENTYKKKYFKYKIKYLKYKNNIYLQGGTGNASSVQDDEIPLTKNDLPLSDSKKMPERLKIGNIITPEETVIIESDDELKGLTNEKILTLKKMTIGNDVTNKINMVFPELIELILGNKYSHCLDPTTVPKLRKLTLGEQYFEKETTNKIAKLKEITLRTLTIHSFPSDDSLTLSFPPSLKILFLGNNIKSNFNLLGVKELSIFHKYQSEPCELDFNKTGLYDQTSIIKLTMGDKITCNVPQNFEKLSNLVELNLSESYNKTLPNSMASIKFFILIRVGNRHREIVMKDLSSHHEYKQIRNNGKYTFYRRFPLDSVSKGIIADASWKTAIIDNQNKDTFTDLKDATVLIIQCADTPRIAEISQLKQLKEIKIEDKEYNSADLLGNILPVLEVLTLGNGYSHHLNPMKLPQLKRLSLGKKYFDRDADEKIKNLGSFTMLENLNIANYPTNKTLTFPPMRKLRYLQFGNEFNSVVQLGFLRGLLGLIFGDNYSRTLNSENLPPLYLPSLSNLTLTLGKSYFEKSTLDKIKALSQLGELRRLVIMGFPAKETLIFPEMMLEYLQLGNSFHSNFNVKNLTKLQTFEKIQSVKADLDFNGTELYDCENLLTLNVGDETNFTKSQNFGELKKLKNLYLRHMYQFTLPKEMTTLSLIVLSKDTELSDDLQQYYEKNQSSNGKYISYEKKSGSVSSILK